MAAKNCVLGLLLSFSPSLRSALWGDPLQKEEELVTQCFYSFSFQQILHYIALHCNALTAIVDSNDNILNFDLNTSFINKQMGGDIP